MIEFSALDMANRDFQIPYYNEYHNSPIVKRHDYANLHHMAYVQLALLATLAVEYYPQIKASLENLLKF